jgi:large subunit ribosomal protein L19|tara:strand:- start:7 stop:600 length:594 start_codon:yes stop_codon:yes gene_type:complete
MEQAMNDIIKNYEKNQITEILKTSKITDFNPGDTVKVNIKIKEGDKERVQAFQGICIAKKNNGLSSSFSVRKISSGEGVERVFPLYSNIIESIERVKTGDVRRAKLYYLRNLSGKKARIAERTDGRSYNDAQFESQPEITEPEVVAEPVAEAAPTPEPVSEAVPETVTETPVETAQEKPKDNTAPEVEVVAEEADKK